MHYTYHSLCNDIHEKYCIVKEFSFILFFVWRHEYDVKINDFGYSLKHYEFSILGNDLNIERFFLWNG